MASTTANRVLYRSPDALQNLRVKVSLTRVSGPRADRAVELEAKLARERGEAQQRADESERHAATMGTIFKEDAPESPERQSPDDRASDRAAAQQAAAAGPGVGVSALRAGGCVAGEDLFARRGDGARAVVWF